MMGFCGGDINLKINGDMPICKEIAIRVRDLTYGDALMLFEEGFCCICEDGKVALITNNSDRI